jgi:hypothetical protein
VAWTCQSCKTKHRDDRLPSCPSCGKRNPDMNSRNPLLDQAHVRLGRWTCASCRFSNSNGSWTTCYKCGQKRK